MFNNKHITAHLLLEGHDLLTKSADYLTLISWSYSSLVTAAVVDDIYTYDFFSNTITDVNFSLLSAAFTNWLRFYTLTATKISLISVTLMMSISYTFSFCTRNTWHNHLIWSFNADSCGNFCTVSWEADVFSPAQYNDIKLRNVAVVSHYPLNVFLINVEGVLKTR